MQDLSIKTIDTIANAVAGAKLGKSVSKDKAEARLRLLAEQNGLLEALTVCTADGLDADSVDEKAWLR